MSMITTKDGTQIYCKDWVTERRDVFGRGWPLSADAWESQNKMAKNNIPRHVGFIPDGNRRWATAHWSKRAQTIHRTFKFEGFLKGIDFVNRIARKAQKLNHHPDIDIRFAKVTLKLTTHDEGGITEKDFSLARQCDEVFAKCSGS